MPREDTTTAGRTGRPDPPVGRAAEDGHHPGVEAVAPASVRVPLGGVVGPGDLPERVLFKEQQERRAPLGGRGPDWELERRGQSTAVRRVAVSLLKRVEATGSTQPRRLMAGWDDLILLEVLQGCPPKRVRKPVRHHSPPIAAGFAPRRSCVLGCQLR